MTRVLCALILVIGSSAAFPGTITTTEGAKHAGQNGGPTTAPSPTPAPAQNPIQIPGDFLTWFFGLTTLVGTGLTIYYNRKSAVLEKQRKRLEWTDLQTAANDLGGELKRNFSPDAIFTPGLRGATFTNLLLPELGSEIPVFVGFSSWKANPNAIQSCKTFFLIETNKWYVHVPECVVGYKDKCILLVDDFAMSGDFLERIKNKLVEQGFSESKIKTACIATTKIAIRNHKDPDFYWMETSDDNFYFPWGRAK